MELATVRALALALPGASEEPHFERSSFRIGTKVFATVAPDETSINVFVDEADGQAAMAEAPDACTELWWGKRLSGVQVTLARAPEPLVAELLVDAWRRKAPKRAVAAYDAEH